MLKLLDRCSTKIIIAVIMFSSLTSCAGIDPEEADYSDDYLAALQTQTGTTADDPSALLVFIDAMSDLKREDSADRLKNAYAESLYFNDTVHTYDNRDQLIEYLLETANRVESINVEIQDVATNNNDYYVRWVMRMRFEVSGDMVESTSIGMSHIRLDDDGKVCLHQDYWDGVNGLYRHIPVVGYLIRKVQSKM